MDKFKSYLYLLIGKFFVFGRIITFIVKFPYKF